MNKKRKTRTIIFRLSESEFNKLKVRAQLYSGGNVSKLIRHWIEKADVKGTKNESQN